MGRGRAGCQIPAQHVDRLFQQPGGSVIVGDVKCGLRTTGEGVVNRGARRDLTAAAVGRAEALVVDGQPPALVHGYGVERVDGQYGSDVLERSGPAAQAAADGGSEAARRCLVTVGVDDTV
jgi:hypothetical protein